MRTTTTITEGTWAEAGLILVRLCVDTLSHLPVEVGYVLDECEAASHSGELSGDLIG